MRLVVVSGLSGAGKSVVLQALADMGFYCVDNLPVPLLANLVNTLSEGAGYDRVAVGVDARERRYLADFPEVKAVLSAQGCQLEVVFLEAPEDVLVRRYAETRRKHPMGELPEAIGRERAVLQLVRDEADWIADTGSWSGRELRQRVRDRFQVSGTVTLALMSFGFRNGVPGEADFVFDCRFLPNPYGDPKLRPMTGLQAPVADYVMARPEAVGLLEHAEAMLRYVAPLATAEGRSYLTFAFGCTGGQHRSVTLVERMKKRLEGAPLGITPTPRVVVRHREIARGLG